MYEPSSFSNIKKCLEIAYIIKSPIADARCPNKLYILPQQLYNNN